MSIDLVSQYGVVGFALVIIYYIISKIMNHLSELTKAINELNNEISSLKTTLLVFMEKLKSDRK